jgi:hypothetical protein
MELNVLERIQLLQYLPREGDIVSLRILQTLRLSIGFTEDEIKKFELKTDEETNLTTWDNDEKVDIPIGEKATDLIVDAFKKMNAEKNLPDIAIDLYDKFVPTTE